MQPHSRAGLSLAYSRSYKEAGKEWMRERGGSRGQTVWGMEGKPDEKRGFMPRAIENATEGSGSVMIYTSK